jgi:penicillin-binding protein 1A
MALVAAVNMGVNPTAVSYPSAPFNETVPKYGPIDVNCYGGHCAGGSKNLVQATLTSDNGVFIRLALDVGPEKVKAAARGLGISSEIQGYPAETLGGLKACCTPLEMADAYATIASGGWRNKPKAITEVKFPDGKIDDLSKPIRHKAFDSAAMYTVTKILEQNIKSGTGTRANIGCPAAGKTGTTNENRNAWFVGFTPHLATSTWVGYPKNQLPMATQFHGGPVDGGTFPAEIWGNYMKAAKGKFCGEFPKPDHAFKTKPFKARHGGGGSFAPTNSFPTTSVPKKDPGTGTTKPGAVATPGGVKPPATTPPPPPPPATGGFDPGNYQAPPADQTPAPSPPAEQVATPP